MFEVWQLDFEIVGKEVIVAIQQQGDDVITFSRYPWEIEMYTGER